jgi:hypothetical protein
MTERWIRWDSAPAAGNHEDTKVTKNVHHGGKEDTETTINAEIAEHALSARFDAAGRQGRPGRIHLRVGISSAVESFWTRVRGLTAIHARPCPGPAWTTGSNRPATVSYVSCL